MVPPFAARRKLERFFHFILEKWKDNRYNKVKRFLQREGIADALV